MLTSGIPTTVLDVLFTLNVLIVKLTSMGDVLFALSMVGDLARHRPEIRIDWAVDESFADLVACCIGIRRVWRLPFRALGERFRFGAAISALKTLFELRSERYDCVIDLQGMIKSGIVALAARGEVRWTYRRDLMAEPMLYRFFDRYFDSSKTVPALDNYRNIGAAVFGCLLEGRADFMLRTSGQLQTGIDTGFTVDATQRPFIVIFPFASKLSKTMSPDQVYRLVGLVGHAFPGCQAIVLSGSKKELDQAKEYSQSCAVQATPRLSLRDTIALISNASGFIGADTGLTYIAAAIGVPTVALFMSTDPAVLDPGGWARQAGATSLADPNWGKKVVSILSAKKISHDQAT